MPYFSGEVTPFDWITFRGGTRIHYLHFDTQHVRPAACSLQPINDKDRVIPSMQGHLLIRPWKNTEFSVNVGTGYHSFQNQEPIGNTSVEQLSHARSYQMRVRVQSREDINMSASIWRVDLGADREFLENGNEVLHTEPSRRQGLNFQSRFRFLERVSITGSLTFLKTWIRNTRKSIPHSPTLMADTSVLGEWGAGWYSRFHMHHIGQRNNSGTPRTSLRPFTTFDLTTTYRLNNHSTTNTIEIMFGVINLTNTNGNYTQFFFDSQIELEYAQIFNLGHFPEQPRTIVSGITWKF